ncbi:TonB-dependent receptor domain-containing protein [Qipengyuania gaetbuli]|uniref:TonB-dependent receptor domain-containing protein n=1 Tax=Qipengyuania gaetbuli TaxID=266952 RepID=UPI001CD63B9C|nr:TonB-dependent receptor [Qipengyuania gaetbuli]MCA0910745.1 TonB-dependent receptor [Qipengyuania gaetbuli]
MKKSTQLRLSAGSLSVALAMVAAPAFAQDADVTDTAASEEAAPAIIVTGTRLNANPNLESAAPVLSVSSEQIQSTGTVRIEDLVNQLPQVFAGQAGEVSNGASGTATLDLRGLGSVRTLVLIDGRRLPYGSSQISSANLDLIPTQLIERVDILTGGASAVYGSDAVGGVANFILKRDFEGVELDFQGGFQQHGNDIDFWEGVLDSASQPKPGPIVDGAEYAFTGIFGTNTADGRGNVTIYANYEKREAVTQNNRAFSACTVGPSSRGFEGVGCVGSGNFRLFGGPGGFAFQQEDGTIIPYAGGPQQTYNFGQRNFFQRPSERFTLYGKAYYEISDNVEAFADISYVDNFSDAQIAETASFGIGSYSINCDNPYIQNTPGLQLTDIFGCSAQDIIDGTIVSGITASHRNVEGGPRNSRLENSAFRIVGGFRGTFGDIWDWEAFGQYAETSDTSTSTNDFVVSKLQQAFFATTDANGNVVCVDPSGGCVPYNPFQRNPDGTTAITPDQYNFIQGVGIVIGETSQLVLGANLQADLGDYGFKSPLSEEGVAFLVGVEYRQDKLNAIPDEISQVPGGGFTGVGGATLPVSGRVDVHEFYSELQIPLITDRPFFNELVLAGQYRHSEYEASGNDTTNSFGTDAFGAQLSWSPVDSLTLRANFQRAVRAPNVIELYTGQNTGLPNLNVAGTNSNGVQVYDPCATNAPIASLAACANTGVTAAQYGTILDVISGQTQALTGGNPQLQPESSDTWTFGAVFEPTFVPGLSISVDYFDITVEDYISAGIAAQVSLDNCLATGDPTFCDLITRGPGGTLAAGPQGVGFQQTNINIAELTTSGIDGQISYRTNLGSLGGLNFNYAATYLDTADFIPFPGGDPIVCAGYSDNGCLQPVNAQYRHRLAVTWESDFNLDATVAWRHYSEVDAFGGEDVGPNESLIDDNLPARNYVDLSMFYDVTESITLRFGVNNILNANPPVSASSGPPLGNGNTYPTIYDTGRSFFAGLNIRFGE